FERDELGVRQRARKPPCLGMRDDAIALAMEDERRRAHALDDRPRVERERQLEKPRRDLRFCALALKLLEPPLSLTIAWIEKLRQRARAKPPVRAHERGERPLHVGRQQRLASEVAREEDDPLDVLRMLRCIRERDGPAAGAAEEEHSRCPEVF